MREKDRYDLVPVQRVFKIGDKVRVRIKSRQRSPAKFASIWSRIHKVFDVKGVSVSVREINTGRVYFVDHDQLTNLILHSEVQLHDQMPKSNEEVARSDANPVENLREEAKDLAPSRQSPERITRNYARTCGGRVVYSTRHPDFEYKFTLCEVPSRSSTLPIDSIQLPFNLCTVNSNSVSFDFSFCITDTHCGYGPRHFQMSNRQKSLQKVRAAGEVPYFFGGRCRDYAFIAKQSETLFRFNRDAGTFVSAFDGSTCQDFLLQNDFPREPQYRALNEYEVMLPKADDELPGCDWFENDPNFGYSSQWQSLVQERAKKDNKTLPPFQEQAPPLAQKSSTSTTPVPPIDLGPVTALLPAPAQAPAVSVSISASTSSQSTAVSVPLQSGESMRTPVLQVVVPVPTPTAPSALALMLTPMQQSTSISFSFGFRQSVDIASNAGTLLRSLVDIRSNIQEQVKYEEAFEIVAGGLFVEGEPRTVDRRKVIEQLVRRDYHPSEFLDLIGPHALNTRMTDVPGQILVTMANGKVDNVIGMNEDGVNDLVIDFLRSKVAALAHVPIERILWARIKEQAAKYVILDPQHVLSAKVKSSAPTTSVAQLSQQAELASAFTAALASVFGVRQRSPMVLKARFSTRESTSGSTSEVESSISVKPAVAAERITSSTTGKPLLAPQESFEILRAMTQTTIGSVEAVATAAGSLTSASS